MILTADSNRNITPGAFIDTRYDAASEWTVLVPVPEPSTGLLLDVALAFLAAGCGQDGLAELVLELTGSPSRVIHGPLPDDDPARRQPDITLAEKRLGWKPTVALREGLVKTIDWFRSIELAHYRPPTP